MSGLVLLLGIAVMCRVRIRMVLIGKMSTCCFLDELKMI